MTRRASINIEEPRTKAEWHGAVDEAEAWLLIDLAIKSGLVEYSGRINTERCREILECGRKQGIQPRPEALGELLRRLKVCHDFRAKPGLAAVDHPETKLMSDNQPDRD